MEHRKRPFYRSIRFRLTAWYAFLILAMMVALGLGLSEMINRELRQEVDDRLLDAAIDMKNQADVRSTAAGPQVTMSPPDFYKFPGLLIQIVNERDELIYSSENLGKRMLPSPLVASGDQDRVYTTSDLDGVSIRTLHYPLVVFKAGQSDSRQMVGAVNVGEPLLQVNQTMELVDRILLVAGIVGVAVAGVSGWFLAGHAIRPVDRITATAASIATGSGSSLSLATRLDVPDTDDELARLASTFNQMLDRLEETFNVQRRFVADASHELRTPLTAIRGNIDVMLRQASTGTIAGADLSDALDDLRRESARMSRLIEDLLTLARTEAPPDDAERRRPVRLDDVVDDVLRTAASLTSGQRLNLITAQPATIVADRDRITELILILVDNAIRHTPPGGEIQVSLETAGARARLTVRDTGEGIAPEHLPHVFDRFYRAEASRDRSSGGTGLGLAIAQSIAHLHGGEISVTSAPGAGATFTVSFPLIQQHFSQQSFPISTS